MSDRNEYPMVMVVNSRQCTKVIIDQHYKLAHPDMNDELILKLVEEIDGGNFNVEVERDGFEYFKVEPVVIDARPYRLVLVLYFGDDYLGVINAFRVQRGKRDD